MYYLYQKVFHDVHEAVQHLIHHHLLNLLDDTVVLTHQHSFPNLPFQSDDDDDDGNDDDGNDVDSDDSDDDDDDDDNDDDDNDDDNVIM